MRNLDPAMRRVLHALPVGEWLTAAEAARRSGLNVNDAARQLSRLYAVGLLHHRKVAGRSEVCRFTNEDGRSKTWEQRST